jgi:hypothetical protein
MAGHSQVIGISGHSRMVKYPTLSISHFILSLIRAGSHHHRWRVFFQVVCSFIGWITNTLLCSTSCKGDSILEEIRTGQAREELRTGLDMKELMAIAGTLWISYWFSASWIRKLIVLEFWFILGFGFEGRPWSRVHLRRMSFGSEGVFDVLIAEGMVEFSLINILDCYVL